MLALFISLIIINLPDDKGIKISWDANTESDLAGYRLYNGLETGIYGSPLDVGDVTEFVYDPEAFDKFFVYYAAVTAYDAAGNESGFSSEVSFRIEPMQEVRWVQPTFNIISSLVDSTVWAEIDTAVIQGDTTGAVIFDFLISHSEFSIFESDSFRIKYKKVGESSANFLRFVYDRDTTIITVDGDVTYEIMCRAIKDGIESIYSDERYFKITIPEGATDFSTFKLILRIPFRIQRD